jgi:hypothetical protein
VPNAKENSLMALSRAQAQRPEGPARSGVALPAMAQLAASCSAGRQGLQLLGDHAPVGSAEGQVAPKRRRCLEINNGIDAALPSEFIERRTGPANRREYWQWAERFVGTIMDHGWGRAWLRKCRQAYLWSQTSRAWVAPSMQACPSCTRARRAPSLTLYDKEGGKGSVSEARAAEASRGMQAQEALHHSNSSSHTVVLSPNVAQDGRLSDTVFSDS